MRIACGNQLSPTQNLIAGGMQASARNAITAVTDPYFANVVLLAANENGADGTTTFIDQSASAHALTAVGNVQWDTAQAPSGLTSSGLWDGAAPEKITALDSVDWYFTGNVTFEMWIRWASVVNTMYFTQSPGGTGNA